MNFQAVRLAIAVDATRGDIDLPIDDVTPGGSLADSAAEVDALSRALLN